MAEHIEGFSKTAGLPPGTLIHVGRQRADDVRMRLMHFSEENFAERDIHSVSELEGVFSENNVHWLNVDGLHRTDIIAQLGEHFKLHPLLLEDILDTQQRPKVEEFAHGLFVSMKVVGIHPEGSHMVSEQVSFILLKNWVISFQEEEGDIFDGLRKRIKESKGFIRKRGADFLLYRLIDTAVDNYFFVTEFFTEQVSRLEESVLDAPESENLIKIQAFKKMNGRFRRLVLPLREVMQFLQSEGTDQIEVGNTKYFRDVADHVIQAVDTSDSVRDLLANAMDLYLSGVSNKMNQVMQVLTIIATIFIPLTFIAGIYGMNFQNMPELSWEYGYLAVWALMLVILVGMLVFFRRKKWL